MKLNHTRIATVAIFVLIALAGVSCHKEIEAPIKEEPVKTKPSGNTLKVWLENQEDEGLTKVSINGQTGAASWTAGDQIAFCISNGSTTTYQTETIDVTTSELPNNIPNGYSRVNYAIYPASAKGSNYTTPTVVYATSYDLSGKNAETYSPMPMVAINTTELMEFYHVGGLLRLRVMDVDPATTKIAISINGIAHVTGTYTVSNAGTPNASVSLSSGTGNTVTFTSVPVTNGETILNIPLPTGSYASLTGVTVKTYNSANVELQSSVRKFGWAAVARTHAKRMNASADGPIKGIYAGFNIAPAPLYYDGNNFVIKDDDWNHDSYSSAYGKTPGSYYFNFIELGQYFDSRGNDFSTSSGSINNAGNKISYSGYNNWRLPSKSEINSILYNRNGSNINGIASCRYALIQLTGVTHAGNATPTGMLIAPDDETMTNMSRTFSWNTTTPTDNSEVTLSQLQEYLDCGCAFIPASRIYVYSSWSEGGTNGYYFTTDQGYNSTYGTTLQFTNSSLTFENITKSNKTNGYTPARLIRNVPINIPEGGEIIYHLQNYTCDGTDAKRINTNLRLFNPELFPNGFKIVFTITPTREQSTLTNTHNVWIWCIDERDSPWPGFGLRQVNNSGVAGEITQIEVNATSSLYSRAITVPGAVGTPITMTIYYNGKDAITFVTDQIEYSYRYNFTSHNFPLTIGGNLDANSNGTTLDTNPTWFTDRNGYCQINDLKVYKY